MPKNRYERRELTHSWEDIRPLLKDSAQTTYEVIRPVLLFGISPKERSEETGMSKSSIYYKANLFDFAEIDDPVERRRTILKLHSEGWTPTSIAGYLETSRQRVHATLKRWAEEQFAGLEDKSRAHTGVRKVDLKAVHEVKKLSENPLIGAYRVSAALEQMGIKLSRATCGRLLALNRDLYHLQVPSHVEYIVGDEASKSTGTSYLISY